MPHVTYIATRSLRNTTTPGSEQTLKLQLAEADRERITERSDDESLGGEAWSSYFHARVLWHCQTRPLNQAETAAMREFLDSVEDGQVFEFDPVYPPAHALSTPRPVKVHGNRYRERRAVKLGDDQARDRFAFSFVLREI